MIYKDHLYVKRQCNRSSRIDEKKLDGRLCLAYQVRTSQKKERQEQQQLQCDTCAADGREEQDQNSVTVAEETRRECTKEM